MNGIIRIDSHQGLTMTMKKKPTASSPTKGHHLSRPFRPTLNNPPVSTLPMLPSLVSNAMTSTVGWAKGETDNLLELEYKEEIFQYMKQMEKETMAVPEHMDLQPELTWDLRPLLVDFLIEIHNHFNLQPETLYLAMNMMDRYLSKRVVYKKHYQLVGMTSLWISSKYEDSKEKLPSVSQLCKLCSNTYDEAAFITMERHILKTLDYSLGHPTAEAFLKKDLEISGQDDQVLKHVAQFLMELTMFQRCFLSFGSSTIAASALFLARSICRKQIVVPNDPNVFACIQYLDNSLTNVSKTVHEKYARSRLSQASIVVKEWVDNGGRALIQPISTTECSNPLWTLSNMLCQPPSPIPTTFLTTNTTPGNGNSAEQCQTGYSSSNSNNHTGYNAQTQQQQSAQPQPAQPQPQHHQHHAQQQQLPPPQQQQQQQQQTHRSQQPHQMHSGRHHSHSASSIHCQYAAPNHHQQHHQQHSQQQHHQRTGSSVSAHHVAYAALPQQPQPAVITHQTTYDIRPVGTDCGARWVDINVDM
ncbi:hypothetical protein BGZ96_010350 [Linnemannia gamsii]|uniref:Cyclin N-terminal domain-containing protein n=1 Tax=Linnemannia gamsii TaxID=64522 RepID=A0ABQ7JV81_9FUNG|nr:hypothetical protein BGZ96_010350 [Linnemannia gamsii]